MAQVYFAPPPQATPLDRQALRDAWIRLLERWEWEWFCTFTSVTSCILRPLTSVSGRLSARPTACSMGIGGTRRMRVSAGAVRWNIRSATLFTYHALLAGVKDLRRLTWMDRWNDLAGYARIEPIESSAAVARYVSKYVVKGGEIDLGGPLVPQDLPLFEAAFRPGDHTAGSEAGSVKAAASAERSEGSLDGFCQATTLSSPGRKEAGSTR